MLAGDYFLWGLAKYRFFLLLAKVALQAIYFIIYGWLSRQN